MSEPAGRLARHGWSLVDAPRRPVLFVNPRSGDGAANRAHLPERARQLGIEVVVLTPSLDLAQCVENAVADGADALGMAGGDGSLAVVASAAAARGVPFICIPAGTRNHFALDVGVNRRDLAGALEAFTDGAERRIDLAYVNGRPFVNNVSLGIYGDAVRRSVYRDAKVRTLMETAEKVIGPSRETSSLYLVDDAGREHSQIAVVLVSNNPYALNRPPVGSRPSLSQGILGVVVLDAPRRGHVPGRAWSTPAFEVLASEPVPAGIDGEAVPLTAPLRFESRPGSLRVRISARHPGVSPSGRVPPVPSLALARGGSPSPPERSACD